MIHQGGCILDKVIPVFSEYNIKRKSVLIIFFITLCILPIIFLIKRHDIVIIWIVFLLELILLPITIIMITDHVSVYHDRIETGSIFSKSTILFNEIKGMDIKVIEQSYRWKKWKVTSIIFLNNQNYTLLSLPVKSTNRIHDIILAIEKNNSKIKLGPNLIQYFSENIDYTKRL